MAFPLQQLSPAGADWARPNKHGVSPLLLLLRHRAGGRRLPATAQQLLDWDWKQHWTREVGGGVRFPYILGTVGGMEVTGWVLHKTHRATRKAAACILWPA